jgi:hypothetical protein
MRGCPACAAARDRVDLSPESGIAGFRRNDRRFLLEDLT